MRIFTRYRILNAVRTMVAEVGVERVTMRGVAAIANITAAAIYRHFRNKKEMLDETVAFGYRELSNRMLKRSLKATGKPRTLHVMADEAAVFAERHPNFFQMMMGARTNDSEAVERLEHEVAECMRAQVLPGYYNPARAAVGIWSLMRGFLARRPVEDGRRSYRELIGLLCGRLADEPRASAA